MHEFSIAQSIVESALHSLHQHQAKKVSRISLQIGFLSGVVKEALEFVFPEACLATALEGCSLEIEMVPVKMVCKICSKMTKTVEIHILCSFCGSTTLDLIEGTELIIKEMEVQ